MTNSGQLVVLQDEKLGILLTCELYSALTALLKSLKLVTSFPKLQFGDIYVFVENSSPYTAT